MQKAKIVKADNSLIEAQARKAQRKAVEETSEVKKREALIKKSGARSLLIKTSTTGVGRASKLGGGV